MEKKDTLSSCSESEEQQMQLIQDKSKESCMVSFQRLHSHLKRLSNNDLKGSRTENGFGRAFATLFGQDFEIFTGTMFLNMDQLQKQLDNNEFQEIGSMASFKVLETQFQMFINSQIYLNDEYIVMTRNYFLQYTQLDILEFRETLVQFMEYVKKSIDERALHKIEYDSRVNERQTQTTVEKVDTSKELDASSVIIESNGTESQKQDTSSRSRNDADIRPIYDEEPMAEVQMTADDNVSATGQQHTEQPESNNEGEVDQNADQCYDTCHLPAKLTNNRTTELSNQLLESENVCLKKTVAQFQKDFGKLEAHCINLELQMENNVLKSGQQSQFLKEKSNEAKVKNDIDVTETINIELEHSVAKLLAENEQLHKEKEHLKQTYKDLFDSIKRTRVQTKDQNDSLMAQLNKKSNENADVLAQIQKKGFAIAALKNELRKLTGNSVNTKFAKPSILGKPVGQPLKNQSVVRQPTAFKSERPRISKPRFASQVDVNNDLSKPVTTHDNGINLGKVGVWCVVVAHLMTVVPFLKQRLKLLSFSLFLEVVSMVCPRPALAESRHVKVAAVPFEKVTPCGVVRFLKIEFFGYETIDVMYRVEFFNKAMGWTGVWGIRSLYRQSDEFFRSVIDSCYEVLNGILQLASELRVNSWLIRVVQQVQILTVAGARETVGSPVVQKTGIQCFNCKGFGHYARECRKPKRVKDYAYHKEKMMMCKQAEQGVPLQAEQADWLEDTDEEIDEQELEAHYSYMAKIQEVSPAESSSTDTPLEQVQNHDENDVFANVRRHSEQPESINDTYVLEKDDSNVIPDSSNICTNDNQVDQNAAECVDERAALANLIANLTLDTEENKTVLKQLKKANASLTQELKECKTNLDETSRALGEATSSRDSSLIALQTKQTELEKYTALNDLTSDYKILQTKLNETLGLLALKDIDIKEGLKTKTYEISVVNQKHDELVKKSLLTRSQFEGQLKEKTKVISDLKVKEGKDIDTMIEMDKQIKFLNEILYKRNQSIQTIHMLAPKCATYHGRSTFANPKYLKKAQSDKPRLYEIPYDTSDPANRFCPNGEETVTLEKESRSKLDKDKVKPYDYTYQNSLYETFKPPSKTYLDQLERAKEVRKTMWRKTFVRTKPNIAKNVGFLPMSKSISKSRLLYNEMTNNFNHFRTICEQAWSNHTNSAFPNPTAKSMEVLIKTLLMPLSNKTILDSHCFVHELKKEMHDDLEYVKSLEKEIDELESEKADFSNIYDLLLEEYCINSSLFIVDSGARAHDGQSQAVFAPILGYGDLIQGNVTIKQVYYVEGLNHNLFSVGQLCDADLEVAFRKSNCFVRDLQGNDLLTGRSLLHHSMHGYGIDGLSHLNFDYITPYYQRKILSQNKALNIRLPLLEHLNRMALSKDGTALLLRLLEQCSQLLSFHYHFELKDGENLEMKEKGDLCVMVGYSTQANGYCVYNKRTRLIVESIYIKFDEIKEMMSDHNSSDLAPQRQEMSVENVSSGLVPQGQKASDYDNSDPVPPRQNVVPTAENTDSSQQGLEFLFSPLLEEYYNPTHGLAEENNNDQAPNASFQGQWLILHGLKQCKMNFIRHKTQVTENDRQDGCLPQILKCVCFASRLSCSLGSSSDFCCPRSTQVFSNLSDGRENDIFLNGHEGRGFVARRKGSLIQIIQKSLPSKKALYELKAKSKSWPFLSISLSILTNGLGHESLLPADLEIMRTRISMVQSTGVDAPPDYNCVPDDEDDDIMMSSADVARSHGGDGGGDDRPPSHVVPTGCGGCFANKGKGKFVRSGCTTALNVLPLETDGESVLKEAGPTCALNNKRVRFMKKSRSPRVLSRIA
ncbi:integrase, catalytic region, zinc finger, CCHC-type containing protein [Tanacetum coccineum]